jgi:hypothetical protein
MRKPERIDQRRYLMARITTMCITSDNQERREPSEQEENIVLTEDIAQQPLTVPCSDKDVVGEASFVGRTLPTSVRPKLLSLAAVNPNDQVFRDRKSAP